jgi:hypothetical protein
MKAPEKPRSLPARVARTLGYAAAALFYLSILVIAGADRLRRVRAGPEPGRGRREPAVVRSAGLRSGERGERPALGVPLSASREPR